jgi:uncharacterized membrane protein YhaH (DUF805 family)
MDFVGAIKAGFTNYATFSGVASRAAFWYWKLFTVLLSVATTFIPFLGSLASMAIFLPDLAVSIRRSRDAGFSAWFMMLWFAPVVAIFMVVGDLVTYFTGLDFNIETATDDQLLSVLPAVLAIFAPVIVVYGAVSLFFLITWLMPTKTREQGNKLVK